MSGPALVGFFGKLPARGDFVRSQLPAGTIAILDDWIARGLQGAHTRLGAAFEPVWHAAPCWRFTLRGQVLHPGLAATGVWVPSIDRAGRCFPLVLLALHPSGETLGEGLDALEAAAIEAVSHDMTPERLQERIEGCIAARPAPQDATPDRWSRRDARDGRLISRDLVLPEADDFVALLERLPGEDAGAAG